MINTLKRFLRVEISSQELYEDIVCFINSFHIRNGEFEGNYHIIKKMDSINFMIYAENIFPDGHREIPYSITVYKNILLNSIQNYASEMSFELVE